MKIFGTHDDNTLEQINQVAVAAEKTALMADGHLGYVMPIGGVAAYRNKISVTGVGFDIACGNAAIRTDMTLEQLAGITFEDFQANPYMVQQNPKLQAVADEIADKISFGIGRSNQANDAPVDHELFDDAAWGAVPNAGGYRDTLIDKARDQLGTVGSGNHYVDVFVAEDGYLWVGVHFGSRGLGHTIASNFLAIANGGTWGDKPGPETPAFLRLDEPSGIAYWNLMSLAGQYAYAGREWTARKVVDILGANELELIHNHHNFAWKELIQLEEGGTPYLEELIVIRKGATPAYPGQKGFVGGSMGDVSVILKGVTSESGFAAMHSTVHGAGRVMSRTEAKGKVHRKTGRVIKEGKVSPTMMRSWLDSVGVILRGGGLDESPHAYRRLPDVLADQGDTIRVLHKLHPVIVAMAPAKNFDPYKD